MPIWISVVLIGAASGIARDPSPGVDVAAVAAIEFCAAASHQSRVTIPAGYLFYQAAQGTLAAELASMRIPTTADAPPLVQRFASTSPAVRLGGSADYLKVPATKGEVWIVLGSGSLKGCDVMVTGVKKIAEVQEAVVNGIRNNPKWTLLHSTQADATTPIIAATFTQAVPTVDKPSLGLRLKIQALRSNFAKPDGIQLEANVVAGNFAITPTISQ